MKAFKKAFIKTLLSLSIFFLFFAFWKNEFNPAKWDPLQRLVLALIGLFSFYAYQPSIDSILERGKKEKEKEKDIEQLNS